MGSNWEGVLAAQCAPAMVGIKPSNLLVCLREQFPDFDETVEEHARLLSRAGVEMKLLCRCERRWLLLIYRPECLKQQLQEPETAKLLRKAGYPVEEGMGAVLETLCERMQEGFPHEIGLLLGYPAEDVVGFCENEGRNYRCCGQWKVYSDVERAKRMFARFDRCRDELCRRVGSGIPLLRVLGAA